MPMPTRVCVIYNPCSGSRSRRRLDRMLHALAAQGVQVAMQETVCAGDAEQLARGIRMETGQLLAVGGGDGTINEVINGLSDSPEPLLILPLGTANVLAHELGLPMHPEGIARALTAGTTTEVHLPTANGRKFAMMAGAGFDACVVASVDRGMKRLFGKLAYVLAFVTALRRFPFPGYEVQVDDQVYRAASVVVANGHFYGGRFSCAPSARVHEPDLHVCLFLRSGRRAALRYALALLLGSLPLRRDIRIVRGRSVVVHGRNGEPVHCDGDIGTVLPLRIEATHLRLRVISDTCRTAGPQRPATVMSSTRTVGESIP